MIAVVAAVAKFLIRLGVMVAVADVSYLPVNETPFTKTNDGFRCLRDG